MSEPRSGAAVAGVHDPDPDSELLAQLGYQQHLKRSIGKFTSFCIAFSIISATTAVFTTFGYGLTTGGPAFFWTYPIAIVVLGFWVLIVADLATKIPISGYAYQWSSRLIGRGYGWFTGWFAIIGWIAGMTGVTFALAGYFGDLIGINMTTGKQAALTVAFMVVVMAINIGGVRLATRINNVGAMNEIVSTIGITVIVAIVAFIIHKAPNNVSFLFSKGHANSPFIWAWLTSALTGLWGLLGSESVADVAEETKDTASTIPRAIFMAFALAAVIEFAMFAVFTFAVPNLAATENSAAPLAYITQHYLGTVVTKVFIATVVVSMFACSLANMLAITRLTYSMARDNMLPFSGFFGHISPRFRSPVNSILVAGTLSCLFVIWAQATGYIVGLSALGFYLVMLLMGGGLIVASRQGRIPAQRRGFNLGRWRPAVYVIGTVLFLATVLMLALTPDNRVNGRNMLVVIVLGILWYALALRRKIARGEAGAPPTAEVAVPVPAQEPAVAGVAAAEAPHALAPLSEGNE